MSKKVCSTCGKEINFINIISENEGDKELNFCSKCHSKWEKEKQIKIEQKEQDKEEAKILKQIEMLKRNATPCPQCGKKDLEVVKKGFSTGMGSLAGLLGGSFLMGGTVGMERFVLRCKGCGHKWEPLDETEKVKRLRKAAIMIGIAILIFVLMKLFLD
ncbi:MAG: hypothetical protein GF383_16185 [Candidatus Lokiarchaeota archaeon]|nr:hypothetical protein [Candidatus Lokiarchaeota archaeon]